MAGTNTFAIPSASVQQVWVDTVVQMAESLSALDYSGITGGMEESPVYDISSMYNGVKGIYFNVPSTKELSGEGKSDDEVLTGNEEAPVLANNQGTVHIRKHAVGLPGEYEQQKTSISFQTYFINRMKKWSSNRRNYDFHASATASLTYDPASGHNVLYPASNVTTVGGITSSHKMSVSIIRRLRTYKNELGIGDIMVPGFGMVDGILFLSPAQIGDLKADPEYQELYQNADVRGDKNLLFRSSSFFLTVIDNILICQDKAIPGMYGVNAGNTHLYTAAASGYRIVEGLFMGASALGTWKVRPMKSIHPDDRDYGNQLGHGISMFYGFVKVKLNLGTTATPIVRDNGLIYVPTAASILS